MNSVELLISRSTGLMWFGVGGNCSALQLSAVTAQQKSFSLMGRLSNVTKQ